jgi:predicted  nucleic acid-binding Zn ribbon protein
MHQISITYPHTVDRDELFHAIYELIGYYRHNGQIRGREFHPYLKSREIAVTSFTPAADALDRKYANKYVIDGTAKLEKLCDSKLKIEFLGAGEDDLICTCQCIPFYVLLTGDLSPIYCGGCGNPRPLYLLPKLHDFGYWNLIGWENNYRACDILDLNCAVGERWAIGQKCRHDSALATQGREICQQIAKLTDIPTYYYLPNYRKISRSQDRRRSCPSCGSKWLLAIQEEPYSDFKCSQCYLVSSLSNYST